MSKMSFSEKITVAAGSVSLAAAPLAADAVEIRVTGSPISLSIFDNPGTDVVSIPWDVDGANGPDFNVVRTNLSFTSTFGGSVYRVFYGGVGILGSSTFGGAPYNSQGMVGYPGGGATAVALPRSFAVGPTLNGYDWAYAQVPRDALLFSSINISTPMGSTYGYSYLYPGYGFANTQPGDNYIGFRFAGATGTHYGWAIMNLDENTGTLTIEEWTYNDEADQPVHINPAVAQVPEPAGTLPAIALLALGAAGLRSWRQQRA